MLNLIISERAFGKTTALIEKSALTGIPIVCADPKFVKWRAQELGLEIPEPLSYYEPCTSYEKVYIDELERYLRRTMGAMVDTATISVEEKNYGL